MHILAMAKTKGGVGSSTLGACLAVEASSRSTPKKRLRVGILDADPQRSLERWLHIRKREDPKLGFADRPVDFIRQDGHLDDALQKIRKLDYDLVIVDGPPGSIETTDVIITAADYVLIASQPSPMDLGSVDAVVDLVQFGKRPFAFVLNRCKPNAIATNEARAFLQNITGGEVIAEIGDRTGYSTAMLRGAVYPEIEPLDKGKPGRAAQEIADLWDAIEARMRTAAKKRKPVEA